MKLVEHLEFVINLVGKAPDSEIKGHLIAMREEVSGYEAAATNQAKFDEEQSKKDKEIFDLKAEIARRDSDDSDGFSGFPPPSGVI